MANQLKMADAQAILALVGHGWSYRRIGRELGMDQPTTFYPTGVCDMRPSLEQALRQLRLSGLLSSLEVRLPQLRCDVGPLDPEFSPCAPGRPIHGVASFTGHDRQGLCR